MFCIDNTLSFNSDSLVEGDDYDYVTRTSNNQGILKGTGFVNEENINPAGVWSLGLLQMDFFYRQRKWYAGQFVRKITSKNTIPEKAIPFFTAILNHQKPVLLSVLVRNVDDTFKSLKVKLPVKEGKIDYVFMENFITEIELERKSIIKDYLKKNDFLDCSLTKEDEETIKNIDATAFEERNITTVFKINNTKNILSRDIVEDSGSTPYLCASAENNSVSSYITYKDSLIDKGNCIFIGGKTFVVSYQEKDFYSNDSHNLALYLKDEHSNENTLLYLSTCVFKGLNHKYSWGDSISGKKIQKDSINVPVKNGEIDYELMEKIIVIVKKMVIKELVKYVNE